MYFVVRVQGIPTKPMVSELVACVLSLFWIAPLGVTNDILLKRDLLSKVIADIYLYVCTGSILSYRGTAGAETVARWLHFFCKPRCRSALLWYDIFAAVIWGFSPMNGYYHLQHWMFKAIILCFSLGYARVWGCCVSVGMLLCSLVFWYWFLFISVTLGLIVVEGRVVFLVAWLFSLFGNSFCL